MMFPDSQLDTTPSSKAVAPVVWVQRLVIVDTLQSKSKPIRDIEFRRGLNIIATTEPSSRERRPVGHNVGKTLLTRLIRYCLGETHFASDSTRKAIATVYPGGYVFAEIVLNGESWAVARPIGADKPSDAWCMQTDSWQTLNAATEGYQAYTVFADLLNKTLTDQYGEFELPNVDKPAVWPNLLAWLSRDQYCRYRNPIEWRSATSGSNNPELSPEDSSLLIRMVMDVLDRTERQLAIDHKRLLEKHAAQLAKLKSMESSVSRDREFLKRRLDIDEDLLDDDLFSDAAKKCAESEKSSRSKKLEDLREDEELKELELAKNQAGEAWVRLDQDLKRYIELHKLKQGELLGKQEEIGRDITESFSSLLIPCEYPEERCDAKQRMRKPGRCNPLIQQRIDMLKDELTDLDRSLGQVKIELDQQEAKRDAAKAAYDKYKAKLDKRITEATESLRPIHVKIEEYYSAKSKNSTDRVFYERRNRQYIDSNVKPHEVISLAAQIKSFVAMMLLEPHSTHRYYGELLTSYRDRIFHDSHSPALYYASGLGLVKIETLIREGVVAKRYRDFRYHLLGLLRIRAIGADDNLFGKMQASVETILCKLLSDDNALRLQMVDLCKLIDQIQQQNKLPRYEVCRRKLFTDKLFELASHSFGPSVGGSRKLRPQGIVTYWNDDRGFGFVRLDERFNGEVSDAFVHFRNLIEIFPRRLEKERRVECDLIEGQKGLEAHNVRYL